MTHVGVHLNAAIAAQFLQFAKQNKSRVSVTDIGHVVHELVFAFIDGATVVGVVAGEIDLYNLARFIAIRDYSPQMAPKVDRQHGLIFKGTPKAKGHLIRFQTGSQMLAAPAHRERFRFAEIGPTLRP